MDRDISLDFLIRIFKKTWWKIVIVTVAVMLLVATFTHFFIPKKYSSSIEFYVVNVNTSYDYTTTSLLSASSYLINDYVSIIKSDLLLNMVKARLEADPYNYKNVTVELLRSMISSSSSNETSIFILSVSHTNKTFAFHTAEVIAEIAPSQITDIAKPDSLTHESLADKVHTILNYYNSHLKEGQVAVELSEKDIAKILQDGFVGITTRQECIRALTPPMEAKTHDSPNVVIYTLLGGMIAALLTYLIFLARHLFELNISSEEDIKKMLNRPLIGTVPHWELTHKR